MTVSLIFAAFMMGFFGSPHCLGMCGGLVTAFGLSMQSVSPGKKRALVATYHVGRLISYASLGIVAGLIGTAVLKPLMMGNHLPRVLLGLVLAFIGLSMLGLPFLNKLERLGMRFWQKLSPVRQKVFPIVTFPRALAAGLLWGFLPCGLVYGALLMSVVGHNVALGGLLMFVFGLGTVPMLVVTQKTAGWLRQSIGRYRLRQFNGVLLVLSGVAVIAIPLIMQNMKGHDMSMHGQSSHSNSHSIIVQHDSNSHIDTSEIPSSHSNH